MSWGLYSQPLTMLLLALVLATPAAAGQELALGRERPAALVPLYITFAGLQVMDVHSTMSAVEAGARESNPMMRSALGNPPAMFLLKSAATAGVVLLNEKLWPRNRTAALVTMIALNSVYATIAAHNYRTIRHR